MNECVTNIRKYEPSESDNRKGRNVDLCHDNADFMAELSGKIDDCSENFRELASAISQINTDVHMVNDSIDVISDTSDTIYGVTEFMKHKTEELIDAADFHRKESGDVIEDLCDILEALHTVRDQIDDSNIRESLSEIIQKSESLTELLSDKIEPGYEEFTEVAQKLNHDIEMIEGSICDFVNMSHDIQNVVKVIADSMDEIVEEVNRTDETIQEISNRIF